MIIIFLQGPLNTRNIKRESSDTFVTQERSADFYVSAFLSSPKKMGTVEIKKLAHQNFNYQC